MNHFIDPVQELTVCCFPFLPATTPCDVILPGKLRNWPSLHGLELETICWELDLQNFPRYEWKYIDMSQVAYGPVVLAPCYRSWILDLTLHQGSRERKETSYMANTRISKNFSVLSWLLKESLMWNDASVDLDRDSPVIHEHTALDHQRPSLQLLDCHISNLITISCLYKVSIPCCIKLRPGYVCLCIPSKCER